MPYIVKNLKSRRREPDLGRVTERFVHSLRNPLFSIGLDLHTLRRMARSLAGNAMSAQDFETVIDECDRQLDRAELHIRELVDFLCPAPPDADPIDLHDELEAALDELSHRATSPALTYKLVLQPEPIFVLMDARRLEQAVGALLVAACGEEGPNELLVTTEVDDDMAKLTIENPCWETTADERRNMFEPYFRIAGREPRLSLAVAWRNLAESHGSVECLSGTEGGACFCVRLPIHSLSYGVR